MLKAKEMRDQSLPELEAAYHDQSKKLYELQNAFKYNKKRENPSEIKEVRHGIARLLTVITQKRNQNQK